MSDLKRSDMVLPCKKRKREEFCAVVCLQIAENHGPKIWLAKTRHNPSRQGKRIDILDDTHKDQRRRPHWFGCDYDVDNGPLEQHIVEHACTDNDPVETLFKMNRRSSKKQHDPLTDV